MVFLLEIVKECIKATDKESVKKFLRTTFDENKTILDGGATRLVAQKYRTGSTHIYQKVGLGFIEADSLYTSSLD